jgi:hypothetical protein
MNCRTFVHELSRDQPKTTKELLDIATRHASGKEAVVAIFVQGDEKAAPNSGRGASLKAVVRGTKRSAKGDKRGLKQRSQQVTVTTSCDEGGNDKEVDDSDEELVATVECDFKHQACQPADHIEKLLEATCPNYVYPVRHKLKECTMMTNYMTMGTFAKGKKPKGDSVGKATAPFFEEKAVRSISDGPTPPPHEFMRKLKLISRAVITISMATLVYLH